MAKPYLLDEKPQNNLKIPFPTELAEQVIDNLSDDASSIAICALVCKQWMARSRFHLFAPPLNLHSGALPGFQRGRTEADILALKALANSPLQTFAPFIRELNVMGPLEEIYVTLNDLSRLTNITTLIIECTGRRISIPSELEHILRRIPTAFPHVRILRLIGGEFTLAQFTSLACGFEELTNLHLDPVRWSIEDTKRSCSSFPPLPRSLRTLDLGAGAGYYTVLPWIISHEACLPLDTLYLETTSISSKDFANLRDLLRLLGPSLHHLSLFFLTRDADAWWSKTKAVYISQYLTLEHNTELQTLSCGVSPKNGVAICSALIKQFLPTLRAPQLESVTLLLSGRLAPKYVSHGAILLAVPWANLDECIAPLPAVERLQILYDLHAEDELVVKKLLPLCEARGIVFFQPQIWGVHTLVHTLGLL